VDAGVTWREIDGSGAGTLPDIPVNCIVPDPTNPLRLYLGTDMGVFVSIDGGATWAVENNGFANAPIESLSLLTTGGTTWLFAFTHGRGAHRVALGGACTSEVSAASAVMGVEGGRGSINVSASRGDCPWTAESSTSWITISGGASARGNGVVSYEVAQNGDYKPRSGAIAIAGKSFVVMQAGPAVSVSAASLKGDTLAPESIVSAFGAGLAPSTQLPADGGLPLSLANTAVTIKDVAGVERKAPLFFVSPNQVNYQMPSGMAEGPASVMIANGADGLFSGLVRIARVAPGLFTANASGQGAAVGNALRAKADGTQRYEPISRWDAAQARFVASPIELGPEGDQVYLILYGTGFRLRSGLPGVSVRIGGVDATVLFAGPQPAFAGLDQLNILVPRGLAGRGEVELVLLVDGQAANVVRVNIK
jgi:uncharacterized protein (TIGR03437 family)